MRELKHILVVEADNGVRKSLELMLQKYYDVHCEKYGKMAVAYVKYQRIDLILLDMDMLFLNGLETLEMFRRNSDYELIPVVFLTGRINHEMKERCRELGAVQFLTLPIEEEKLIRTLDSILYEKRNRTDFSEKKEENDGDMVRNLVPIAESVLLVGENREFLERMREYLRGYLPRVAIGMEEALQYLDKLRPAVIYVEDSIACTSDFNLIRKMRMQPYAWEIPLVIFSQEGRLEYELQRYQKEGINLVLQNPTKKAVLEALKEALS